MSRIRILTNIYTEPDEKGQFCSSKIQNVTKTSQLPNAHKALSPQEGAFF
jgi:hypothetical protein